MKRDLTHPTYQFPSETSVIIVRGDKLAKTNFSFQSFSASKVLQTEIPNPVSFLINLMLRRLTFVNN